MKEIATILGVPVVPYTMDEAVAKLTQDTLQRKRNFVVTANAEIIMMAQDDKEYKTLLAETADLILPDGAGTVWAGNYLGYTVPERVAGYDLYLRLLEEAARRHCGRSGGGRQTPLARFACGRLPQRVFFGGRRTGNYRRHQPERGSHAVRRLRRAQTGKVAGKIP